MRKILVTQFVSLDGVTEAPETWSVKYWSDPIAEAKTSELFGASGHLLGRRTYDVFASSWPSRAGDPFADRMNALPKYVVSNSLREPSWSDTTIISGDREDVATRIKELKEQDDDAGHLLVGGSGELAASLLENDLVDELALFVYPVVLGTGKRLANGASLANFEVIETTPLGDRGVTLYRLSRRN